MTRQLQDPDLPARFPMETRPSRDENGETLVVVRCNDGTIWMDTGERTIPWRKLPAIPEPTAEEVEAAERARRAALEEGMRQHEALQEAVRANQERLREERRESDRVEMEARHARNAKEVEQLAPIRPHWSFW